MAGHAWGPASAGAEDRAPDGPDVVAPSDVCPSRCGAWWVSSDSPTTPCNDGTRDDGATGSLVARRATRPSRNRAWTSGVAKADSSCAAVPVTGTNRPVPDVAPTVSPVDASQRRVADRTWAVGPNAEASCPAGLAALATAVSTPGNPRYH